MVLDSSDYLVGCYLTCTSEVGWINPSILCICYQQEPETNSTTLALTTTLISISLNLTQSSTIPHFPKVSDSLLWNKDM